MTEKWELCMAEEDQLGQPGRFHFFNPEGHQRLLSEAVIHGTEWYQMSRKQKNTLRENQRYSVLNFEAAICKLLDEGWMPIGVAMSGQASNYLRLAFRRPYRDDAS